MSNRHKSNIARLQATKAAKSWQDDWRDTQGGFNPDVFTNLDDVTRQKLIDYQIGPRVLKGDKLHAGNAFSVGHWLDAPLPYGTPGIYGMGAVVNDSKKGHYGANRSSVQNAAWEMGLPNIETPEQLTQFLDRTDALTAKHGNFLEDGWDPKDIMLYREAPQEVVATADPVVATPVETTVDVPEVVEQEPVPKEPTEGVDYMSSDMRDTYDRMQDYNTGFKAEDWIAKTSESDRDKQEHAQKLADMYKFKINEQFKEEEIADKVSTAVGNTLGVFSGYSV